MMLRFFLFSLLVIASTYSYQLNEEENDIELTEEDVLTLLKRHMQQQDSDPINYNKELTNDAEGEELTEDHVRELLHKYMNTEQDSDDNDDDDDNDNGNDDNNEIEKMLENENADDQVQLLNEISDESFNDEEFDMSSLKSKDPKALWGVRWPRIRVPRVRFPRIRLPRIRFPRIRFPRIRIPRIRIPRIRIPRIRLPRIRIPRIRWPRIRIPKIRFRFILPRKPVPSHPNQPPPPNPCPWTADQIVASINSIKCDNKWKQLFDYPDISALFDTNEFFLTACKQHQICVGCMNTNPWTQRQCDNKLKQGLNSFCEGLAEGDVDTLGWCNGKIENIITHERAQTYPTQLYYCPCGDDVTSIGKP